MLTRLQLQLYNVHTGGQVWKKTEKVTVAHQGSLQEIVLNVAVPSLTAGLLPPLIDHVQAEYLASLRGPRISAGAVEPFGVFGGAELAKIDAELAPPSGMTPPKDHAYAVIVGVEDYRDLPKVDYAKRDAEMVRRYLVKALGYREQNIVTILNDRVTKSQLEARLEKWLPKQIAESRDAEVFVYYGGHGAPDPTTNQAFLVPYDGDPAFLETLPPRERQSGAYEVLKCGVIGDPALFEAIRTAPPTLAGWSEDDLDEAIALDSSLVAAHVRRAQAHLMAGDPAAAAADYAAVKARDPTFQPPADSAPNGAGRATE